MEEKPPSRPIPEAGEQQRPAAAAARDPWLPPAEEVWWSGGGGGGAASAASRAREEPNSWNGERKWSNGGGYGRSEDKAGGQEESKENAAGGEQQHAIESEPGSVERLLQQVTEFRNQVKETPARVQEPASNKVEALRGTDCGHQPAVEDADKVVKVESEVKVKVEKMERKVGKERHKRDRDGNIKEEADAGGNAGEDAEKGGGEDDLMDVDRKDGEENKVKQEGDEADDAQGERDGKDSVVTQRKRHPRLPPPRETRSRFKGKLRESTAPPRSESPFVCYKVGEGLPDLPKLWSDFQKGPESAKSVTGPTLEVRIPADLATTSNKQVRGSQLWGTDIYTDDSDLVAVLWHTGYYSPTGSPPPACILEIRATIRILAPQNSYKSTLRNSVRSRAWGAASGCSFSIERCRIVKNGGGIVELEPALNRTPVVAPTLAPAAMERPMTRAASSNAHRQQRFVQEVTIQYNLCNEPWLKYSMSIVADRGLKKSQYTSARLKKGDVLYVETHTHRYELSYDGDKAACNGATTATSHPQQGQKDKEKDKCHGHPNNGDKNGHGSERDNGAEHYKWSRCKLPLPLGALRTIGVPLPPECIQILEDGLVWDEVQWSPTGVWIRGKEFALARAQFLSPIPEANH